MASFHMSMDLGVLPATCLFINNCRIFKVLHLMLTLSDANLGCNKTQFSVVEIFLNKTC